MNTGEKMFKGIQDFQAGGTFKTADEFYRWCGVDSKFFYDNSLTEKVNKPP